MKFNEFYIGLSKGCGLDQEEGKLDHRCRFAVNRELHLPDGKFPTEDFREEEKSLRNTNYQKVIDQIFLRECCYFVLEGSLKIYFNSGTTEVKINNYCDYWIPYVDIWTYDELCKPYSSKALLFLSIIHPDGKSVRELCDISVKQVKNQTLSETINSSAVLIIACGSDVPYTINGTNSKFLTQLNPEDHNGQLNFSTSDTCHLIILTPKS